MSYNSKKHGKKQNPKVFNDNEAEEKKDLAEEVDTCSDHKYTLQSQGSDLLISDQLRRCVITKDDLPNFIESDFLLPQYFVDNLAAIVSMECQVTESSELVQFVWKMPAFGNRDGLPVSLTVPFTCFEIVFDGQVTPESAILREMLRSGVDVRKYTINCFTSKWGTIRINEVENILQGCFKADVSGIDAKNAMTIEYDSDYNCQYKTQHLATIEYDPVIHEDMQNSQYGYVSLGNKHVISYSDKYRKNFEELSVRETLNKTYINGVLRLPFKSNHIFRDITHDVVLSDSMYYRETPVESSVMRVECRIENKHSYVYYRLRHQDRVLSLRYIGYRCGSKPINSAPADSFEDATNMYADPVIDMLSRVDGVVISNRGNTHGALVLHDLELC